MPHHGHSQWGFGFHVNAKTMALSLLALPSWRQARVRSARGDWFRPVLTLIDRKLY